MEKENSAHRLLALAAVDRIATEKMIIMNRLAERQKKLLAAADVSSQRRVQAAQELSSHRKLAEEVVIFNKIFLLMFIIVSSII